MQEPGTGEAPRQGGSPADEEARKKRIRELARRYAEGAWEPDLDALARALAEREPELFPLPPEKERRP